MRSSSPRGFTLIELLVVIAIIGILASIVLASLFVGRSRSQDADIQSNLHTIQNQMEVNYTNNNTYGATFACQTSPQSSVPGVGSNAFITDPNINGALKAALLQSSQAYWAVGQGGNTYAVAVALQADSTHWWCVDSSGTPKLEPSATMTGAPLGGGANTAAACP